MRARVPGILLALALAWSILPGCGSRPPTRPEPPPPQLTEDQRRALEAKRDDLRQELLALENLPEIQRAMGSSHSLEDSQISLADRQGDNLALYFKVKAQLNYLEQLLR